MMGTSAELSDLPLVANPAVAHSLSASLQRRGEDRIDYHTVVSVVIPGQTLANGRLRIIKGRSENVSVTGARVICVEPFTQERVYLQFLLPGFGDRFVEAEVVTESFRKHTTLSGGVKSLYCYGVRFVGVVSNEDLRKLAPSSFGSSGEPRS